jgi:hypothetical protein
VAVRLARNVWRLARVAERSDAAAADEDPLLAQGIHERRGFRRRHATCSRSAVQTTKSECVSMIDIAPVYHVTPAHHGWAVQSEGHISVISDYADKTTAVRFGQELAQRARGQLVIHREDGSVQAAHWY